MKKRKLLPYGYTGYTGVVLKDNQVDRYNQIQGRINAFIDANMPVPESLLNESHSWFVMVAQDLRDAQG
jgi:hypothetical protein